MSAWQPIETAPRDGTQVLLYRHPIRDQVRPAIADGWCCRGFWVWPFIHKQPTHWMPLPELPEIKR